jgi:hypothetical protein
VTYDLRTNTISFWGVDTQARPDTWESSGQIVSLLDLPGSQLIIQLEYDSSASLFENSPPRNYFHLKRINLPGSISYLNIKIAERRSWTIRGADFKKYKGRLGTTNFVYTFPKTYTELLQHE